MKTLLALSIFVLASNAFAGAYLEVANCVGETTFVVFMDESALCDGQVDGKALILVKEEPMSAVDATKTGNIVKSTDGDVTLNISTGSVTAGADSVSTQCTTITYDLEC